MKFDFSFDYVLEDQRVMLTPLTEAHLPSLLEISGEDYIWQFFFERGDQTDSLGIYIQNALDQRRSGLEYPFVVFDKAKRRFAGSTRLYEYNPLLQTIKIGHTWYGKAFRGTGLNKHCKYLLFQFAFEQLEVERIGFGVYSSNEVSLRALESVGCKKEGVLRAMFPSFEGKGRADAVLLSILKREWEEVVKKELGEKLQKH